MHNLEEETKVSVILPTYNERGNILPLIIGIKNQLKGEKYEIIVVDDNSPDGTWKVVEELEKKEKSIHLIRRQWETGLTSAISEGVNSSNGNIIIWMDTDLSMPPEEMPGLLEKIRNGYDIAVASRYVPGGGMVIIEKSQDSLLAATLSFAMNYTIQRLLDSSFKDYTSGFVAVRKEVLDNIKLRGDYGEYFIDFIYRAIKNGYKIIEVPYISKARVYGVSKTGTNLCEYIKKGIKYIWTTLRLRVTKIR